MIKYVLQNKQASNKFLFAIIIAALFIGCTKYAGTRTSTTTTNSGSSGSGGSSSSGSGPTPLPPLGGTGSSGSGSGSGSGSTGTGGTASNNLPLSYIQGLFFAGLANSYVSINDSMYLKQDGSYTTINAGSTTFKYKVGTGSSSDAVYTNMNYYIRPYSYYSYVLFKSPTAAAGELLLLNDLSTPVAGTTQVRFVSLDPLTATVPVTFKLTNYLDEVRIPNRTYLDSRTDSNYNNFRSVTPGSSSVSFWYRDSSMLSFNYPFEAGKKYTVFAGALSYVSSSKGTLPVSYYQVARHN